MSYTPGPWTVGTVAIEGGKAYGINIVGNDGYHVAKSSTRSAMNGDPAFGGENWENAMLISAAPELLEALKRIADVMDFDDGNHPVFDGLQDQIVKAIAKAEGK